MVTLIIKKGKWSSIMSTISQMYKLVNIKTITIFKLNIYIPGGVLLFNKTKHFITDRKLDFSFKNLIWWHFRIPVLYYYKQIIN